MGRWSRLLGWSALFVVLGVIPLLIAWSSLPDPVATHWGLGGEPNGRIPRSLTPLLQVGIVAIGLLTTSLFRVEGEPSAEAFAMVGLLGGLGVAMNASIAQLNWGVGSWVEASPFAIWHIGAVVVGAAVGGYLGWVLGRRWYPPPQRVATIGPLLEVAPGEVVLWVGRTSVRWPLFLLGGAAVLFVSLPGSGRWIAVVFVALAVFFARVEAGVDNDGLRVRLGGLPVKRYPLEAIESARTIDLEPAAWGGWGWRIRPNRSALILRRGDALEVSLRSGRLFAVTVDDAATGAALLNGLVARFVKEG